MTRARHRYRLYDLIVESDVPLSLSRAPSDDEGESVWSYEQRPVASPDGRPIHDVVDFDGERRLQVWVDAQRGVLFSYGQTRIEWNSKQRRIRIDVGDDLNTRPAIALERMVAPIAFMVEREHHITLHASAVRQGSGAASIFVGDSGAGKSTTALELMRRGMEVLADDLVLIDTDSLHLLAATPSLRLFDQPEAVPEAVDRELVVPDTQKFWYQLSQRQVPKTKPGVRAIYSLEPVETVADPQVIRVRGRQATVRVIAQAFDLTMAQEDWRVARFRSLCRLARQVPVYRVNYRKGDRSALDQVEAIAAHLDGEGADP